jgi:hypothetical protein
MAYLRRCGRRLAEGLGWRGRGVRFRGHEWIHLLFSAPKVEGRDS